MREPLTLDDLQATAGAKGGKCLSSTVLGARGKYRWRCAAGHVWEATAARVRAGTWCPQCAGSAKLTLEDLQETAGFFGGQCLSKVAKGARVKHRWKCARGHVWMALPCKVRAGGWCPRCPRPPKPTLENLQELAAAHEGECLASEASTVLVKHRWRCAWGHEWEATPALVWWGAWCPFCRKSFILPTWSPRLKPAARTPGARK